MGIRFRNEVAETVDWTWQNADLPRLRPSGYRRVNLKIFPHYVDYIIREESIWIVAIVHGFRRPEYWLGRI